MVRVRIGPSPTGDPHVGTGYIALFNYVFARQGKGQFVLRIEDTDQARSQPAYEQMILDALRWLGLPWDEGPDVGGPCGPYRQSERAAIYQAHAQLLLERGGAYRCFCTPQRLAQLRLEQKQRRQPPGYDGACRRLHPDEVAARLRDGVAHVVRLRVEHGQKVVVADGLRGEVTFDTDQIDDQVLQKSDGLPTYHLANVVDDHLMHISHVIRAEEWLTSCPKHLLLYRAFGWQAPQFVHMPLLRNPDKSKISKRKNPVSLNYYRQAGYLPEVMLNYLGMMGWTMPDGRERFALADMVEAFDFSRISLGGPVFDVQKLSWLNGLALRELSAEAWVDRLTQTCLSRQRLLQIAPLVQDRATRLEEGVDLMQLFLTGDIQHSERALEQMVPKDRTAAEVAAMLEQVLALIDGMPTLSAAALEAGCRQLCEQLGWKSKQLFMPLRLAATGAAATPPLFESMAVIGKERCRRRLRAAQAALRRR